MVDKIPLVELIGMIPAEDGWEAIFDDGRFSVICWVIVREGIPLDDPFSDEYTFHDKIVGYIMDKGGRSLSAVNFEEGFKSYAYRPK